MNLMIHITMQRVDERSSIITIISIIKPDTITDIMERKKEKAEQRSFQEKEVMVRAVKRVALTATGRTIRTTTLRMEKKK